MSTYEISKSSLLSLKAEILRKQEELAKVKHDNTVKLQNLKKNAPLDLKNKGIEARQEKDAIIEAEDEDVLRKSRLALEAKSKLYDRLTSEAGNTSEEPLEHRYLVCFDKKQKPQKKTTNDSDDDVPKTKEYEKATHPDEEWVEYTDCLGRTRTCLRKDLDRMKEKDEELREISKNRESNDAQREKEREERRKKEEEKRKERERTPESDRDEPKLTESNELLSSDMRREILRRQWEKEEEELRGKKDVHYQDILFDEARTHGVGYYGFSKDEEERSVQQENLKKLREETEQQQKKSQNLRALREQQLAARAKAARNRKRARMGLPPEAEEEPKDEETKEEVTVDNKQEQSSKEEEEKQKLERRKDTERKKHIRPWDLGKEGVAKQHYEYTQEEWVEKKRRERKEEFAPPRAFQSTHARNVSSSDEDTNRNLYFSTKKSINPYKTQQTPKPIVNELSDTESDSETSRRGVEVPPPPSFDYYGPSGSKRAKKSEKPKSTIEDSITAGLKYLRKEAEKRSVSREREPDYKIY